MVDYKRFYVSIRSNGRVIATEKRRNDIERKVIKPHEIMVIKSANMKEFYTTLKTTFGSFRHHRRRGNWIINYDGINLNNEKSFHVAPTNNYSDPSSIVETTEEETE